jgi:hypothetical protein
MQVILRSIQIASVNNILKFILFEDMKTVNRLMLLLRIDIEVRVAIEIRIYMRGRSDNLHILFNRLSVVYFF